MPSGVMAPNKEGKLRTYAASFFQEVWYQVPGRVFPSGASLPLSSALRSKGFSSTLDT